MISPIRSLGQEARLVLENAADGVAALRGPSLRLGVTGLSRAGKTIFISALVHSLIEGGRLPLLAAYKQGRMVGAHLKPQPDDQVPRFAYEDHIAALMEKDRHWPSSTRQISEVRLVIEYESARFLKRRLGPGTLALDIVDYPGEWLLDLPLLSTSYEAWSREALSLSGGGTRKMLAADWHKLVEKADPQDPEDESLAKDLAEAFTAYLKSCRDERHALSALPPGRFLMPGDMEGSPALTFSPLMLEDGMKAKKGTLHAMMARRFEAYKRYVVEPFFRAHFARLDRQIVLVDVLSALNAGREAMQDLERALTAILSCFRPGRNTWLSRILTRRIDKILFAATKADHLHHSNHARLEAILARLVDRAIARSEMAGAEIAVLAMSSVRATREVTVTRGNMELECVAGTPEAGQTLGGQTFDGKHEFVFFPGDLPENPDSVFEANGAISAQTDAMPDIGDPEVRFLRFRPPKPARKSAVPLKNGLYLPHIRLDRALEFLFGDRLE